MVMPGLAFSTSVSVICTGISYTIQSMEQSPYLASRVPSVARDLIFFFFPHGSRLDLWRFVLSLPCLKQVQIMRALNSERKR